MKFSENRRLTYPQSNRSTTKRVLVIGQNPKNRHGLPRKAPKSLNDDTDDGETGEPEIANNEELADSTKADFAVDGDGCVFDDGGEMLVDADGDLQ